MYSWVYFAIVLCWVNQDAMTLPQHSYPRSPLRSASLKVPYVTRGVATPLGLPRNYPGGKSGAISGIRSRLYKHSNKPGGVVPWTYVSSNRATTVKPKASKRERWATVPKPNNARGNILHRSVNERMRPTISRITTRSRIKTSNKSPTSIPQYLNGFDHKYAKILFPGKIRNIPADLNNQRRNTTIYPQKSYIPILPTIGVNEVAPDKRITQNNDKPDPGNVVECDDVDYSGCTGNDKYGGNSPKYGSGDSEEENSFEDDNTHGISNDTSDKGNDVTCNNTDPSKCTGNYKDKEYPEALVRSLLMTTQKHFLPFFDKEIIGHITYRYIPEVRSGGRRTGADWTHRTPTYSDLDIEVSTAKNFCRTSTILRTPRHIITKNNDWVVIVNQDQYKQQVVVEMCGHIGRVTNQTAPLSLGYYVNCVQNYMTHKMVALNETTLGIQDVELPSCCSLEILQEGH